MGELRGRGEETGRAIQKKSLSILMIITVLLTIVVLVTMLPQTHSQTSLPTEAGTKPIKITDGDLREDIIAVNPNTNIAYVVVDSDNQSFVYALDESRGRARDNVFSTKDQFEYIDGLAVDPKSNRIYVATDEDGERLVYILNGTTNTEINRISLGSLGGLEGFLFYPSGTMNLVDVDPNTERLYVIIDGDIYVIDGSTQKLLNTIELEYNAYNIAVNPNTNRIYIVAYREKYDEQGFVDPVQTKFFVIDGATDRIIKQIPIEEPKSISDIAVDVTTNKVYATIGGNRVLVIDGNSNDIVTTFIVENCVQYCYNRGIAVNSNLIYVLNYDRDSISIIDGSIGMIGSETVEEKPTAIAVNPNTNRVYVVHPNSNTISIIEGSPRNLGQLDKSKVPGIRIDGYPTAIAVNPNTNRVYVASSESSAANTVSVIDESSDNVISTLPLGNGYPTAIAVNPNTNRVYVATEYTSEGPTNSTTNFYNITIFDGASEKPINSISGFSSFNLPITMTFDPTTENVYVIETKKEALSNETAAESTEEDPIGSTITTIYEINSKTNGLIPYSTSSELQEALTDIDLSSVAPFTVPSAIPDTIDGIIYATPDIVSDSFGTMLGIGINDYYNNASLVDKIPLQEDMAISIAVNPATNMVYTVGGLSNAIYIADPYVDKVVQSIPLEAFPTDLAINSQTNHLYVANEGSNTVSVIDGWHNTVIRNITLEYSPTAIAVNPNTNRVYVASSESNVISVIEGSSNQVVVGAEFGVNPSNGGRIECENKEISTNEYHRIEAGSVCKAKTNEGFYFIGWVENLGNNSTRSLAASASTSYSPFNQLLDFLGFGPSSDDNSATLVVQQYPSNFTANFKEIPPPVPSEYLIPLYGIIISTIVGWSIPSIIGWTKSKRDVRKLSYYHKQIASLYGDGKLDENDIEPLDRLRNKIGDAYSEGKLNEKHYESLRNEISTLYDEIFRKKIAALDNKNNYSVVKKPIQEQSAQIRNEIKYAFSKGKINEKHYTLLNEDISRLDSKEGSNS